MAQKHEVVITGMGLCTPLGTTVLKNWEALLKGRSGLSTFKHEKAAELLYPPVGVVPDAEEWMPRIIPAGQQRKMERFTHLALIAAHEAMHDAGFDMRASFDRERFGIYLGVGVGGLASYLECARMFDQGGAKKISPFILPKAISNEAASWISIMWQLQGPQLVMVSACSSSADAVGLGYRAIQDGYADYMLVGGTESCITPESLAAFGNMWALSTWKGDPTQASRPFDKGRTGFVMGEGAGVLVLERKDLALRRGARMYAEVVGYAATADAYHITAMHPEGRGAKTALKQALAQASILPHQVGYINAHGTGTPMNDRLESAVIKEVFGEHASPVTKNHLLVSSTKSMTGHMLGAAGGVEISYTALALLHQTVSPTINCSDPDPECDLDYVREGARQFSSDYALSNSFGFGGNNAVIVLKRV